MNRKLKALGLALVASFAMSAVAASGASASGELFHAGQAHTILDAHGGLQTFVTNPSTLTCTTVTADATTTVVTPSSITATDVTYSGCKNADNITTHVQMRSCDYLFTSEATPTHAPVHIQCSTAGDEIRINGTVLGAEVTCVRVPAQTPTGGGVTYSNVAGGDVKITATVTGIEYTVQGFCGSETVNNGTYNASVTVGGTDTVGNNVNVTWS